MKRKRLIFTLTGISLLDEKKRLLGTRRGFEIGLAEIGGQGNIKAIISDNALGDMKNQVLIALANKSLRDKRSCFSAELASLYELEAIDNNEDKIIFIVSETSECAFAGIVNGKYIIHKRTSNQSETNSEYWNSISFNESDDVFSFDNVEIKIIEGLQVKDGKKFRSEGIKNLFAFIKNKIEGEGASYDEVIFNITGGYKGTIPYLSLFGMLFQESEIKGKKITPSIEYLYEDTTDVITLPNLPIAYDIFTWRNYRGFIKAVPHLEENEARTILNVLPLQISDLFEKEKGTKYFLNPLGKELNEKYDEEKEGELTPYGRGYLLVDKIQDDAKQKALRECINRWQYLWLGDLIPETVEHARGHTQRVLELAAQILYPILNEDPNFFGEKTDDNLLALISAIWLHDLGHSGDYIKWQDKEYEIKGFPSFVRTLHHMLSWYLIDKDKNELFKNNRSVFSEDLIEAIRQICLYHRGKMPVSDTDNKDAFVGLSVTEPLEKLQNKGVNIPLLGALLRVVDAGDVQEERTISPNYTAMRSLQNNREIENLKKEESKYRGKVDDLLSSKLPDYLSFLKENAVKYFNGVELELDDSYKEITQINDKEKDKIKEKINNKNLEDKNYILLSYLVDKCVQNYIQEKELKRIDDTEGIILRGWLSALDQYVFKNSTAPHFEKHGGISAVMYLLDKHKGDKYYYKVLAIHKKDDGTIKKKNAESILKDIYDEYQKVKEILNNNHIYFDSYERMEEDEKTFRVNFSEMSLMEMC